VALLPATNRFAAKIGTKKPAPLAGTPVFLEATT
jgi:hypothetical protein